MRFPQYQVGDVVRVVNNHAPQGKMLQYPYHFLPVGSTAIVVTDTDAYGYTRVLGKYMDGRLAGQTVCWSHIELAEENSND